MWHTAQHLPELECDTLNDGLLPFLPYRRKLSRVTSSTGDQFPITRCLMNSNVYKIHCIIHDVLDGIFASCFCIVSVPVSVYRAQLGECFDEIPLTKNARNQFARITTAIREIMIIIIKYHLRAISE